MRLAVIPARGGSKRIPQKNIREFCGKPIIARSISAAQQSGCFDKIIVSTDAPEIAEVARAFGAETPFLRPEELSCDHTATLPVIQHAIRSLPGAPPAEVCCIYATAPFLAPADIRDCRKILETTDAAYVFPVAEFPAPIQRAIRLTPEGTMAMFHPEHGLTRSQDLESAYHDAGQFYWGRTETWLSGRPIFDEKSRPFPIPRHRVQDIDTPEDWDMAEWMFRARAAMEDS